MRRIDGEDIMWGLAWTAFGLAGASLLGLFAHLGSGIVFECVLSNQSKALAQAGEALNEKVGLVANLRGLQIASIELGEKDGKHFLKVFGSVKNETIPGFEENKYVNTIFEISKSDAAKIVEQLSKLDATRYTVEKGTVEHSAIVDADGMHKRAEGFRFSAPSNTKKTAKECKALYETIGEAIINAKTYEVQEIFEASRMNNSISQIYRYMRPEYIGDTTVTGLFTHGHTAFINAGVMTTSISEVAKDENRGVSYFFIDTVQGREKDKKIVPTSCRLRVEVEGTELTQEEVYNKFIAGEISSYTEIVRNPDSSKLGIVDGEVAETEEIELM